MMQYVIAMIVLPVLLAGWLFVQQISRRFAEAHPEFGPPREEGGGCGSHCGCHGKSSCKRQSGHAHS